jgi:NodT family efflux transporter outer membrane factor (OMF) lipoprotein
MIRIPSVGLPAIAGMAVMLLAAGCTVGPRYHRPSAAVPAAYKEAPKGWKFGEPRDQIDRGAWWSVYRDPVLDAIEKKIDISNQTLKADEAAFREAEALAAEARAGLYPVLTANASAQRSRGGGAGAGTSALAGGGGGGGGISNLFTLSESASWTPDLWGKVRRMVEAAEATAQASAATLADARLSAQGSLASDYLQLRISDELKRLLQDSVTAYAESLRITQNQYNAGTAVLSDVAQAQAQLDSTKSQLIAVGVSRAQFEHAIAVLIGEPPAALSIAETTSVIEVPAAPVEVPSALLERRPDIAVAERQMAAQNAQIGVAVAAFYPDLTLSADSGVTASKVAHLLIAPARVWDIGASATQTLFNGGLNQATLAAARATFEQDVANYRQTVLAAFQQVEDELATMRILADEASTSDAAVKAAREAQSIINNQYIAGTVAYTSVVVAEQTALADAESALTLRQSRLVASAALIQALGGGWDAGQLPSPQQIENDEPLNFSPFPAPPSAAGP